MAAEAEGLRVFQKVNIKIGEAKNIIPYPGPTRMRDCYCTINLDQEEVFRTKVIEKSLCPFYGEEFFCEIPRSFRQLSFYIFDRDVFKRDSSIGKVAVKKEYLPKYQGKDTWFQLQPISADSEVQGKVHVEIQLSDVITDSGTVAQRLMTRVLECQDLPIVNGQCDPYATVLLITPSGSEVKKTRVKKKTNSPHFDEVFYFEMQNYNIKPNFDASEEDTDKVVLRVDLWKSSNLKLGDEFLGEVSIPLTVLTASGCHNAWYFLQPRDNGSKSVKPEELGSLRLNIIYTEDHVLTSEAYGSLKELLLKSACLQPVSASAGHVLGQVCREKQEAAAPLVHFFLHYGKVVPFVSAVASAEISRTQDPNTIFRGNSLASKCIDEVMKLAGRHYLQITLGPIIDEICTSHKPCEIDPGKLKESDNPETNRENLRQYVDRIFRAITTSGARCPTVMCDIFFSLRECAVKHFQGDQDVQYTAVSSFIYLRFFAAAVLTPSLFQLRPHYPDPSTSRTLTLISKTIQTLGSLSKSKSGSVKESYMAAFYDHFSEEEYTAAVKDFLDLISSSQRWDQNVIETPVTLKEGFMRKRAWGRKCCGLKSFQKKWFRLTNHEFIYRKNKGSGMLHRIPVENILAVERLEEESFNKKNMFQVIQPERTLYIQATNCVEARDWINILTKVSQSNRQRLSTYHPLAFLNDLWPCCGLAADSAPGCTPCTGVLPDNIELDIDGDRETERIFCLFSRYMDRLEKMQEACGSKAVYHGLELNDDFIIDDPQETYKTLKQIMAFVRLLKLEHAQYKREKFRKTRYGSEEYPIGDSNFQCFITQLSENSAHGI
ncbi:ras GTPase-activating protein 3-like isoform X1 [Paramormyrops kingsleyae]|uniref:ras GTPase-activating protein 3-like isoform X1 n=2 Tax=Paramormyrops kingsleyae TaxID=1676925 RepID=UPI003B978B48